MADGDERQWWELQPDMAAESREGRAAPAGDCGARREDTNRDKDSERSSYRPATEDTTAVESYPRDVTQSVEQRPPLPPPSQQGYMYNPPPPSAHPGYLPQYPYAASPSFRPPYYAPMPPNMMPPAPHPHMQAQFMPHDTQHGMPHSQAAAPPSHAREGDYYDDGYGMRDMRDSVDHLSNKLGNTDLGQNQHPPPAQMLPNPYGSSVMGHGNAMPPHGSYYHGNRSSMPPSNMYGPPPQGMPAYSDMSMPTHYDSYQPPPYGPSQYQSPYHNPHYPPFPPNYGRNYGASPPPPPPPHRYPSADFFQPMQNSYVPRHPYPESPSHRSLYGQSPQLFDSQPRPASDSPHHQQSRDHQAPMDDKRNYRTRPNYFTQDSEKGLDGEEREDGEGAEDVHDSSDDRLNYTSSSKRKCKGKRKGSVLSADSLENVVGSPVSPMSPSTPISPEYKELSSGSSSAPFSPSPPHSPTQGAIPKNSSSRQAHNTAKNNDHKMTEAFKEIERTKGAHKSDNQESSDDCKSGRSSADPSISRLSVTSSGNRSSSGTTENEKSEADHDTTRDSNESQYDNVPDTFPRVAPFPCDDIQSLDTTEESVTQFRSDSPRVGDVGFVRATLDTPQTLLASTRLVKATLKPSKPTTFFIALESKFVIPDFADDKKPADIEISNDKDSLGVTPMDIVAEKSTEDDRDLSIEQDSLMDDFSKDLKMKTPEASSLSPDNVSVSPADYQESQLVMKHFVENWSDMETEKITDDLDEFFLVLDCDGAASQYHFLSGSTSPRSSCSESFYEDQELEALQENIEPLSDPSECKESKPESFQPMATMMEEDEENNVSLDSSRLPDIQDIASPSKALHLKCSTPIKSSVPSEGPVSPEIPHFTTLATAIKSSISRNTNIFGDALSKLHRSGEELSVPALLGGPKTTESSKPVSTSKLSRAPEQRNIPAPNHTSKTQISALPGPSDDKFPKPSPSAAKSLLQSFLGSGKSFARPSQPRVALGNKPIVKPNPGSGKSSSDDDGKLDGSGASKLPSKVNLPTFETNVNFIFFNTQVDPKKGTSFGPGFPKAEIISRESKLLSFPKSAYSKKLFGEKNNNSTNCENIQLKKELSICLPKKFSKIPVKRSITKSLSSGSEYTNITSSCATQSEVNKPTIERLHSVDSETRVIDNGSSFECISDSSCVSAVSLTSPATSVVCSEPSQFVAVPPDPTAPPSTAVPAENLCDATKENVNLLGRPSSAEVSESQVKPQLQQNMHSNVELPTQELGSQGTSSQLTALTNDIETCNIFPYDDRDNDDSMDKKMTVSYPNGNNDLEDLSMKPKQKSKSHSSIPTLKQPRLLTTTPFSSSTKTVSSPQKIAVLQPGNKEPQQRERVLQKPRVVQHQKARLADGKVSNIQNSLGRRSNESGNISSTVSSSDAVGSSLDTKDYSSKKITTAKKVTSKVTSGSKLPTATKISSIPQLRKQLPYGTPHQTGKLVAPKQHASHGEVWKETDLPGPESSKELTASIEKKDQPQNGTSESNFPMTDESRKPFSIRVVVLSKSLPSMFDDHELLNSNQSSSLSKLDRWSNVRDEIVSKLLLTFAKEVSYPSHCDKTCTDYPHYSSENSTSAPSTEVCDTSTFVTESESFVSHDAVATDSLMTSGSSPFDLSNLSLGCRDFGSTGAKEDLSSHKTSVCPVTPISGDMDCRSHDNNRYIVDHNSKSSISSTALEEHHPSKDVAHIITLLPNNNDSLSCNTTTTAMATTGRSSSSTATAAANHVAGAAASPPVSLELNCLPSVVSEASLPRCPHVPCPQILSASRVSPHVTDCPSDVSNESVINESSEVINDSIISKGGEYLANSDLENNKNCNDIIESATDVSLNSPLDDVTSSDSGRGGFTVYSNRHQDVSDVEISDDNISDFSDEEIVLSVSSENLSDSKEEISEPLFIPSLSGTNLAHNQVIGIQTELHIPNKKDSHVTHIVIQSQANSAPLSHVHEKPANDTVASCPGPPVTADLVSQALLSPAVCGAMEGLPFLKREELDQLATIIANKLMNSTPNSLTNSITSTDCSTAAVFSSPTLLSVNAQKDSQENNLSQQTHLVEQTQFAMTESLGNFSPADSAAAFGVADKYQEESESNISVLVSEDGSSLDNIRRDASLSLPSGSGANPEPATSDGGCPSLTTTDGPASVSSGDSVGVSSGYSVTSSDSGVSVNSVDNNSTSQANQSANLNKAACPPVVDITPANHTEGKFLYAVKQQILPGEKVVMELPEVNINSDGAGAIEQLTSLPKSNRVEQPLNERGSDDTFKVSSNVFDATRAGNEYARDNTVPRPHAYVIQADPIPHVTQGQTSSFTSSLLSDNFPSSDMTRHCPPHHTERVDYTVDMNANASTQQQCQHGITQHINKTRISNVAPASNPTSIVTDMGEPSPVKTFLGQPKQSESNGKLPYNSLPLQSRSVAVDSSFNGDSHRAAPQRAMFDKEINTSVAGEVRTSDAFTSLQLHCLDSRFSPLSLTELAARAHKQHLVHFYHQQVDQCSQGGNPIIGTHFQSTLGSPNCLNQEENIDSGFESVTKHSYFSSTDCPDSCEQSLGESVSTTASVSPHQSSSLDNNNGLYEQQSTAVKLNIQGKDTTEACQKSRSGSLDVSYALCDSSRKVNIAANKQSSSVSFERSHRTSEQIKEKGFELCGKMKEFLASTTRGDEVQQKKVASEVPGNGLSEVNATAKYETAAGDESSLQQASCEFGHTKPLAFELNGNVGCKSDDNNSDLSSMNDKITTHNDGRVEVALIKNIPVNGPYVHRQMMGVSPDFSENTAKKMLHALQANYDCTQNAEENSLTSITSTIRIPMGEIESLEGDIDSRKNSKSNHSNIKEHESDSLSSKVSVINDCNERNDRLSFNKSIEKSTIAHSCKLPANSLTKADLDINGKNSIMNSNLEYSEVFVSNATLSHVDFGNRENSTPVFDGLKKSAMHQFPKMKDYNAIRQHSLSNKTNFVSIIEGSREELDKSDDSFEEMNWDIVRENRPRKVSYDLDKPERKFSDSSGVSSLSDASFRKLSSSSNTSSPGDDWHWFPGRKTSFQVDPASRKISTASSGCTSGVSSMQESQDNRRISVCSGISNLKRIREESSPQLTDCSSSEGDLNRLSDKADSPDGALPAPPPPVWPSSDQKPPKPPRRSTLGILCDNTAVRFDELQVRNCNSLTRDKKLSNKRDRRRTLHTFKNIFDEWHQRQDGPAMCGSLEMVRCNDIKAEETLKCSSDAGLLDDKPDHDYYKPRKNEADTASLIGTFDSCESLEIAGDVSVKSRHVEYFECQDSESDDSDCTGEMYTVGVLSNGSHPSKEKQSFRKRVPRNKRRQTLRDELKPSHVLKSSHMDYIEKVKLRDARSLPNLSDVGEANVLDEPVIPSRKTRVKNSATEPKYKGLKSNVYVNRSEFNISELHAVTERLQGRVKHAQSDDAILEKGYADYSDSEHPSDMEDINMDFFEPQSKLRVSLPRRQPSKLSKRSHRFHQLKRKFSFNSIDKSKELKDSLSTSLQRFKSAKNKFEKLVSKSLKKEAAPPPSLLRASRILGAPTDSCRYAFDDISHSSSGTSFNGHNLSVNTSFNSTSTGSSKNSPRFPEVTGVTRTYKKVSEVLHYEPQNLNGSESSYSWDDADSDFEYFKIAPGTTSIQQGARAARDPESYGQRSIGAASGRALLRSQSESPKQARGSRPARLTQVRSSVGMIPSGETYHFIFHRSLLYTCGLENFLYGMRLKNVKL